MNPEGRIPPQAVDIEKAVLGAMLIDADSVPLAIDILSPENFYSPNHARYCRGIYRLFERGVRADAVTLVDELRRGGELGPDDPVSIVELSSNATTAANVEYHARIVLEKSMMRAMITAGTEMVSRAYSDTEDPRDLLDHSENIIFSINQKWDRKAVATAKEATRRTMNILIDVNTNHDGITGVPSHYRELDLLTGGFQNSDLIIVAGRPSQGKTAFALALAKRAAQRIGDNRGIGVALFSIEMSEQQIITRLLSQMALVNAHSLRTGKLNADQWSVIAAKAAELGDTKLFIDDSASIDSLSLRAKARRLKSEHDIGMVVIDYIQLIKGPKDAHSREQEVAYISRSLKALAKELNIPVIALSQLNRAVENRPDRRPVLADLRESGAIEQDADVVMFVHRPETYGINEVKYEYGETIPTDGLAEIIIGKQRNGPVGTVRLHFEKQFASFETMAPRGLNNFGPAVDDKQEDLPF